MTKVQISLRDAKSLFLSKSFEKLTLLGGMIKLVCMNGFLDTRRSRCSLNKGIFSHRMKTKSRYYLGPKNNIAVTGLILERLMAAYLK